MEEIPCIFCNIPSEDTAIQENGFTGKRCPECGLIYISPRPSFEEIVDLYGHDTAHISAEDHIADELRKRLYARYHLKKIRQVIRSGELLEIGAGAGFFLNEAEQAGFIPHGLEFNPIQAEYIRSELNIPCEESPLSRTVFNGKKFELIFHCDVISHLFNPVDDFQVMHDLLSEDGILVFETGNYAEMNPRWYRYIDTFMYPDHLFFFSVKNLKQLLEMSGFELIRIHRYSILPQLRMKTLFSRLKEIIRGGDGTNSPAAGQKPDGGRKNRTRSLAGDLKVWANYLLRYHLGKIVPKKGRPQTMIVIARKKRPGSL
ncbi:MAG: class I SAM-dependent methyltransferase [Balneolaceae bacterium]